MEYIYYYFDKHNELKHNFSKSVALEKSKDKIIIEKPIEDYYNNKYDEESIISEYTLKKIHDLDEKYHRLRRMTLVISLMFLALINMIAIEMYILHG